MMIGMFILILADCFNKTNILSGNRQRKLRIESVWIGGMDIDMKLYFSSGKRKLAFDTDTKEYCIASIHLGGYIGYFNLRSKELVGMIEQLKNYDFKQVSMM